MPEFDPATAKRSFKIGMSSYCAIHIESTVICDYLEEAYPERPLMPKDPFDRSDVRQWTLFPDASLYNATSILSVAVA